MAQDYSYLGSGKVSMREIGTNNGFVELGNCSTLDIAIEEDAKELKDYTQPGGGTQNEVKRISSVEATTTIHDLSAANLARALYGGSAAVAEAAVPSETQAVAPNSTVPFNNMPKAGSAVTVATVGATAPARTDSAVTAVGTLVRPATANGYYYRATVAGTTAATAPANLATTIRPGATVVDGTVTWVCAGKTTVALGTDYDISAAGVFVKECTIAGETWTFGYTRAATDLVQALVTSGKEYELLFEGLNEARTGKRVVVRAYRVKLGAAKSLSLIGEDFAAMEVSGKLLKDQTKTGIGASQYMKVEIEA